MSKELHFIVRYDIETKQWNLDIDTLDAKFQSEYVFDTETQEWIDINDNPETEKIYSDKEQALAKLLQIYSETLLSE